MEMMNIHRLLSMNLHIPAYQRPYKWTVQNIEELLEDIRHGIDDAQRYGNGFKYRIGTIILHRTEKRRNAVLDVVDGQQRIISLVLLNLVLDKGFCCGMMNQKFTSSISQQNIVQNFTFIQNWFSMNHRSLVQPFSRAMKNVLEVVVIQVDKVSEAFQLFDSQNFRGKALEPHDLLKAYHLREMKDDPYEMEYAVTKWEAHDTAKIRELFDLFFFPIGNWSRERKSRPFTAKEIDAYKGISEKTAYTYAKRASKAMPYFQITEPFIAGNDFFAMVEHYLVLRETVEKEIRKNADFAEIHELLEEKNHSVGFGYARNLFYCALFMYYDKFHNFDTVAVKKMFTWSFMLRVDMESLGFDSVNKYAIGEANGRYTNQIGMFSKIRSAWLHTEISNLQIRVLREPDDAASKKWRRLYEQLKIMNGLAEEEDGE